jgi:hypothetical protein
VTIRSDGEASVRGYAVAEVPAPTAEPAPPLERVLVVDPTRAETLTGPPLSSGPRNPGQLLRPESAPKVELLDGQPLTKGGRVWIDPELLAQWEREEAERKQGR